MDFHRAIDQSPAALRLSRGDPDVRTRPHMRVHMMFAERPVAVAGDVLSRRIYAPHAYRLVREAAIVPVVWPEGFRLAACFPLVWRRRGDDVELVAVRALVDDARAHPVATRAVLPLVLQAYPFVLAPDDGFGPATPPMLDDVVADAPTDRGASVTGNGGRPSRATTARLRCLALLTKHLPVTRDIGRALREHELLDDWDARFAVSGSTIALPDLLVVRPAAYDTPAGAAIMRSFGMPAAEILGLHRISLYRSGALAAAAAACLGPAPPAGRTGRAASDTRASSS